MIFKCFNMRKMRIPFPSLSGNFRFLKGFDANLFFANPRCLEQLRSISKFENFDSNILNFSSQDAASILAQQNWPSHAIPSYYLPWILESNRNFHLNSLSFSFSLYSFILFLFVSSHNNWHNASSLAFHKFALSVENHGRLERTLFSKRILFSKNSLALEKDFAF